MCGIFGFVASENLGKNTREWTAILRRLCILSETRGKDASGVVCAWDDAIYVLKRPVRARVLTRSKEFEEFTSLMNTAISSGHPFLAMGHTRMVTNGNAETHENNQPVVKNGMVCLHNGIVVNDADLWKEFPDYRRTYEVDTEIILALINHYRQYGQTLAAATDATFTHIKGANSVAVLPSDLNALSLATSNGSLFLSISLDRNVAVFASERFILSKILTYSIFSIAFEGAQIEQIKPGSGRLLEFSQGGLNVLPFGRSENRNTEMRAPAAYISRTIHDMRPIEKPHPPLLAAYDFAELERLCVIDYEAINSLKRCSKCILPETFPFISFDEEGVCNYCRNHRPLQWKGQEALQQILIPLRHSNHEPDCLVPISGGRDSSYALHFIKKELNMNPVAYTYDWGMVTDLARRNISRMCGALGVEHLLISADIAEKRASIAKNVLAWLKKPHLGTVTLFMAGDKHFFYFARILQKQMRLNATLFGMNPLERTDFKVGFCGIDENFQKDKHYSLALANKIKMMFFFGTKFLENQSYINSTLLDSFFGFFAYYLIPKDYLSVYDYIRWDERLITKTLLEEYNWETAPDTKSTWRIGDGTAPFYNYIYYRVAGFSENDTFQSNQIREGMLTREEAWKIASEDNQPRVKAIKWYCDTVDIDCCDAIKRINTIPTLYGKNSG